jgi:hypothetical protein
VSDASYEKLGAFYLGRRYDLDADERTDESLLYDSKDLTTHAVCVGMTGSGKTGLGIGLLEEAVIDGIPVIAIDPKGDLANLMLTFPRLAPSDFQPWIDESTAARRGRTPEEEARATASLWREGLAEWGQPPDRIARFAAASERVVYTPGSRAGRPLAILRSLAAPPPALLEDDEALRERVAGAVSGLLGLLGIRADPFRSREHILLSTLLDRAWRAGTDLELGTLIRRIQKPPVERVGVLDLESFFPASDRFDLAMALNNLLASPGFSIWAEGDALEAGSLLFTPTGRPKLSIISIAHLSDAERMFVVTSVLNELIAWMRTQPGSRTLRALLYMDEVFGYFPPTANPPSKTPMLTLLKQARAYGLGCVLATQNPVDLDYKGLSNAGTWFLGRLQTERDKSRVIEGLEGASAAAGGRFDRARTERVLAGLRSRVFLMNNVHEDEPVVFETRWALSYLAGPLTREQLRELAPEETARKGEASPTAATPQKVEAQRPVVPAEVTEGFLPVTRSVGGEGRLVYRPAILGAATLHYVNARAKVDEWSRATVLAPLGADAGSPWAEGATFWPSAPDLEGEPEPSAAFAELPPAGSRAKSYERWRKMLATHLHRSHPLRIWRAPALKQVSQPGEGEGAFRGRLREVARERRDLAVEKLRKRFAPKLARLADQIERAEVRVEQEREQYGEKKLQSAISIGATIVGALFGRKLASTRNVGRATTAARGVSRAARERGDIARAEERVETLRDRLADLEGDFQEEVVALEAQLDVAEVAIEPVSISPRKSDLDAQPIQLVWTPWRVGDDGIAEPLFEAGAPMARLVP